MTKILSKFVQKSVDFVKSGVWIEPLGKTLEVTAAILELIGHFVPLVGIIGGAVALASALLKLKDNQGIDNSRVKKLENKIEQLQSG